MRHKWKETDWQRRECEKCGCIEHKVLVPAQFGNKWQPIYYYKTVTGHSAQQITLPKCTGREAGK